jgi:hypothetical protein
MDTLIIDRSKWLRGTGAGALLNGGGKMCCLGFECKRLGLEDDVILDIDMPDELMDKDADLELPEWLSETHPESDVYIAAQINDRKGLIEEEREQKITKIFAAHDIEVKFIDGENSENKQG